jgi:hypothetical protein
LAILLSAVFWTLIWGFPGLLLSTPMTVCLMVAGRYVPSLGFLSILLGNKPVMKPHAQYYQRLLAGDQAEARQILDSHMKQASLEELYDSVVIPALARSEEDGHRNELDEETRSFINSSTREIAEEIADSYPPAGVEGEDKETLRPAKVKGTGHLDVLCVPARDEADDVVAMLLCQLLQRHGMTAETVTLASTAEMAAEAVRMRPAAVCISALPPLAMNHTRALYAKLRADAPDVPIVVCLWHVSEDPQKTMNLLKLASGDHLFSTLTEALGYFSGQETKVEEAVSQK